MNTNAQAAGGNANAPPPHPPTDITASLASVLASQLRAFPQQMNLAQANRRGSHSRCAHGPSPSQGDLQRWALAYHMRRELITLQHSCSALRRSMEGHGRPSPEERAVLRQTEASLKSLARMQDFILSSVPLLARPTEASAAKARQVFEVAELLEKILLCLDFGDMLSAQLVNRTFARAFERSGVILQEMGLQPSTDKTPFSPLASAFFMRRGINIRLEDHHRFGLQIAEDELVFSAQAVSTNPFGYQVLPQLTDRFRNILVCQPPLKTMRVRTDCCNDPLFRRHTRLGAANQQPLFGPVPSREEEFDILPAVECETGITLGHIFDETRRFREEHKYCADAHQGLHLSDGTVNMQVHFEAILHLELDDPLLERRRQMKARDQQRHNELNARDRRMQGYVAAKQAARDNDQPIPTMEEFLAAQAEAEAAAEQEDEAL